MVIALNEHLDPLTLFTAYKMWFEDATMEGKWGILYRSFDAIDLVLLSEVVTERGNWKYT